MICRTPHHDSKFIVLLLVFGAWVSPALAAGPSSNSAKQELSAFPGSNSQTATPYDGPARTDKSETEPGEEGPKQVDVGTLVRVDLTTGDILRGTILSLSESTVVLSLPAGGEITLQRRTIRSIQVETRANVQSDGSVFRRDPNRTRYLYSPSALSLEAGEGYFSQKELLFSAIAVGLTDNITLLLGTMLPFLVAGEMNAVAAAKVSFPLIEDTLQAAVGAEAFFLPAGNFGAVGFVFGSLTYGNDEAHLTLSTGKPFSISGTDEEMGPLILTLSGSFRVHRNIALVAENWLMPATEFDNVMLHLHGLAARLMFESIAVDLGGVFVQDIPFPIPWIDFTYNW
jgi:hypothetical protein